MIKLRITRGRDTDWIAPEPGVWSIPLTAHLVEIETGASQAGRDVLVTSRRAFAPLRYISRHRAICRDNGGQGPVVEILFAPIQLPRVSRAPAHA